MPGAYARERDLKAEDAAAVAELLAAAGVALANYEWIIDDHPELDPDGDLLPEVKRLREAMAACKRCGF
jgi:hypothetical protein